jgi:hypothetical protein
MKIKLLLAIIFLQGISVLGQQSGATGCTGGYHPRERLAYALDVWNRILLDEEGGSFITITIGDNYQRKFVLRAKNHSHFEVRRFEPKENIFKTLHQLEDTCQLPGDPAEALRMLDIQWETREIDASQFEKFHRGFTEALKAYVLDSQTRYRSVLDGDIGSMLDGDGWDVAYDNHGFEHIYVIAAARKDKNGKLLPLPLWAHDTVDFAESLFAHRPVSGSGPQLSGTGVDVR